MVRQYINILANKHTVNMNHLVSCDIGLQFTECMPKCV